MKTFRKIIVFALVGALMMSMFGCATAPAAAPEPAAAAPAAETTAPAAEAVAPAAEATSAAAETTTRKNDIVRVGFSSAVASFTYAFIAVAQTMGYFAEEGIDVVCDQSYSSSATRMVSANQDEFAIPGPHLTVAGISNGLDCISVYQVFPTNIFGFAVMADSDIHTIQDLEGKVLGTSSPTTVNQVNPILWAAGVDPSTVEMIPVGEARIQQLTEGNVDACWSWDAECEQYIAQGNDLRFISGETVYLSESNSIITNPSLVAEYPELITGFCRAIAKASYFCHVSPRAAADATLTLWPTLAVDLDTGEAIMASLNRQLGGADVLEGTTIGMHDEGRWDTIMKDYVKLGIAKEYIDLNKCFTNEFIEAANDFDREAIKKDAEAYVYQVS